MRLQLRADSWKGDLIKLTWREIAFSRFIPSEDARREAAGASTAYVAEDVIQINHARATGSVGGAGNETRNARYFVVDSVEALSKFGGAGKLDEAW